MCLNNYDDSACSAESGLDCDGACGDGGGEPVNCDLGWELCLFSLTLYDAQNGTNWYEDCSACADTCAQNPDVPQLTDDCYAHAYNIGAGVCPDPCAGAPVDGCTADEFDCLGDGTECIPGGFLCDGTTDLCNATWPADCSNGADEGLDVCADVEGYADECVCGDGVCEGSETYDSCPDDCDAPCEDETAYNFGEPGACAYTCEDLGLITDCDGLDEDEDGFVDCVNAAWLGDGLCDGEDQQWGADLTCYGCDAGDCGASNETGDGCLEDGSWGETLSLSMVGYSDGEALGVTASWNALLDGTSCEENNAETCWNGTCSSDYDDGVCPEEPDVNCDSCLNDYTAYGSECCDTAWLDFAINCATLEGNYGWDCSGCACPGDLSCEEQGLVTCEDGSADGPGCAATADDCLVAGECPDGQILDCDGTNECHPATWLADGLCDGEDQEWGADLTCYGCDQGDCGLSNDAGDGCLEDNDTGDGDGDGGDPEICEEGYCPEGTYWDGGSCYDCCYCLTAVSYTHLTLPTNREV